MILNISSHRQKDKIKKETNIGINYQTYRTHTHSDCTRNSSPESGTEISEIGRRQRDKNRKERGNDW